MAEAAITLPGAQSVVGDHAIAAFLRRASGAAAEQRGFVFDSKALQFQDAGHDNLQLISQMSWPQNGQAGPKM
jgi:hypothetical protein